MNCGIASMAKKANLARQWQEVIGQAEVTDRQPSAPASALYLMQLRAAARKISPLRRRVAVVVEHEADAENPRPVKINRSH
jgi:hypothetical protein